MAGVVVAKPGMLTTVQDRGRWGLQGSGVPVAGPMDPVSHRVANRLLGNQEDAAMLEVTLIGPELVFEESAVVAVCGAEFALRVDGAAAPMWGPIEVRAGARLTFGPRVRGARAYCAIAGGVASEPVFGSRATSLVARMGPFGGRALAAGDRLPLAPDRPRTIEDLPETTMKGRVTALVPLPQGGARLRVMWGPQEHLFTEVARDTLTSGRYVVTPQSNRMGYRLDGPRLAHRGSADILSDATPHGTLQVPGSGQPILLMADRQTAGGYPKIATVITADLALAGQLAPGDWVAFVPCDRREALAALRDQEALVSGAR
ncbi:MAG: biotin-dependent carboxyltransferase family protein [Vicinamibacterales bacterium]